MRLSLSGAIAALTCLFSAASLAEMQYHRIVWDRDPATEAVIGFSPLVNAQAHASSQVSSQTASTSTVVRYGYSTDESRWVEKVVDTTRYFHSKLKPGKKNKKNKVKHQQGQKGAKTQDLAHKDNGPRVEKPLEPEQPLTTHFVRLSSLKPDSAVYFRVCKSGAKECGDRFWFKTAPIKAKPFVAIAGGDTRTGHTNRRQGNKLVAKIRPLFVMHGGDYTNVNNVSQVSRFLDDWQLSYSQDTIDGLAYKRIYPLLPTHGNHEDQEFRTLCLVFGYDYNADDACDVSDTYGAVDVSPLLRVYTLNSQYMNPGYESHARAMNSWLAKDMSELGGERLWRLGQYHKPIFPHVEKKSEAIVLHDWWADTFYRHNMNLVVESDSHMNKLTYPLRPQDIQVIDKKNPGNSKYIASPEGGTVFVGEGSWGAPARSANDPKDWTIDLTSIQQFKVISVTPEALAVRTAQFDGAATALSLQERARDPLALPANVNWWSSSRIGEVFVLNQNQQGRTVISNSVVISEKASFDMVEPDKIKRSVK